MEVYNESKTKILENYDLEKGYLVEDSITVNVPEVKEQKQEDYVINGVYTIVKPYIKAVPAHIEERPVYRYVLYTKKELEELEIEKQKETYRQEKAEKEQWLREHDYIGVKIATGRATREEYAEEIAIMAEYALRIDVLNTIIGE